MLVEKVVAPAALLPTARLLTSNTMSSSKLLRRWGSDSADYHMKPRAEPHTERRECTRAPAARPETHKHTAGPVHTSRTTLGHGDTEGVNVGVTDDDGVLDGVTLADGVFVAVPDGDGVNDGVFVAVPDIDGVPDGDGVTDAVAVAVVAAVVDTDGVADGDADAEGDAPTLNDADGVAEAAGWAHAACSRVAVTRIHSPRPSRAILVVVAAAARSSGSSHRARSLMQACSFCRRNHLGDWSPERSGEGPTCSPCAVEENAEGELKALEDSNPHRIAFVAPAKRGKSESEMPSVGMAGPLAGDLRQRPASPGGHAHASNSLPGIVAGGSHDSRVVEAGAPVLLPEETRNYARFATPRLRAERMTSETLSEASLSDVRTIDRGAQVDTQRRVMSDRPATEATPTSLPKQLLLSAAASDNATALVIHVDPSASVAVVSTPLAGARPPPR